MAEWPRTMQRGPLRGQSFQDQKEYLAALREWQAANPEAVEGKRERKSRTTKAPKSSGPVSFDMALGLVKMGNVVLSFVPATKPKLNPETGQVVDTGDLLEEYEQKALALAIVETAKTNKFFANIILKVCSVGSSTRLVATAGGILAVRLAKHGVLDPMLGIAATQLVYTLSETPINEGEPPTFTPVNDDVSPESQDSEPMAAG